MSFFRKMFGEKSLERGPASATASPCSADPANDPNMIRVYDGYGRELFITKQQWKDNVLLGNLETARDNPEQLYGMLVGALHDGFAADIIPYAEHLRRTDPIPSRGAAILGIVYMDVNRLDDAERVLNDFIAAHGEDGVVLTNLAKIDSRRGDNARAEAILWHALKVDPNQDNGLGWYAAIQRDRGGEPSAMLFGVLRLYHEVGELNSGWLGMLFKARTSRLQSPSTWKLWGGPNDPYQRTC